MQQLIINFDATGMEGYESANEYFAHCAKTAKTDDGRTFKQHYQAAEMGMSPSQWSQKLNRLNGTGIMLDEAVEWSQKIHNWEWVNFVLWLKLEDEAGDLEQLNAVKELIERRIANAKKNKRAA